MGGSTGKCGENQSGRVTSLGTGRWSRKAALAPLVVGLLAGCDKKSDQSGQPEMRVSTLTDGERAALIAAARAIRERRDPRDTVTPEQRVDLDRVYQGIERSRFGFYDVAPALSISSLVKGAELAAYEGKRHADQPDASARDQAYKRAIEDAASALERGDVKAAFAAVRSAPDGK